MSTPSPSALEGQSLDAFELTVDPLVLRDVEAGLLGLLAEDHLLGGPVAPGPTGSRVRIAAEGTATPDQVVLRDHEHTPLAALTDVTRVEEGLAGILQPLRRRESGEHADLALQPEDLAAASSALLVLDRPVVAADGDALRALLTGASESTLLLVVPDAPGHDVPLTVRVATARGWLSSIGAQPTPGSTAAYALPGGGAAVLRTAPLAWRDPVSDEVLLGRLVASAGSLDVLRLTPDDASPGALAWRAAANALETGRGGVVPGVAPEVAAALLRWRAPRATRGLAIMFTGLSGSGKSTVARDLSAWIRDHSERRSTLLDGDLVRQMLSSGLGFDRAGRIANVRRIGYVASEIARHGGIAICSPIAPYAETRAEVRAMVDPVGDFFLVHVNTPLEECERRDLKGLYAQARAGVITEFTGISDPYDEPTDADLRVDTSVLSPAEALDAVLTALQDGGWLEPEEPLTMNDPGHDARRN